MKLKKTELSGSIPVWQFDKGAHMAVSGFNLDTDGLAAGATVPTGSALGFDESTRVATLLKSASVVEAVAAAGKAIKVAKGHLFAVGDFVIKDENGASTKVNSVVKTDPLFDVLNVETALGAIVEGEALVGAKSEAAEDGELFVEPKGLSNSSKIIPEDDYVFTGVRLRGTIYARRAPALPQWVKDKIKHIIFSDSF